MDPFVHVIKFGCVFCVAIFFILLKDCCSTQINNFGESCHLECTLLDRTGLSWYHNGIKLQESPKIKPQEESLYVFCLDPSDSGTYRCENDKNVSKSYQITVENPENRTFMLLYNKYREKCVMSAHQDLIFTGCDLNDCKRKWSWNSQHKLVSAIDSTMCISVDPLSSGEDPTLEKCTSSLSQKWQCGDNDVLSIEGTNLYLSHSEEDKLLLSLNSVSPSGWLNYFTGKNLCVRDPKERTVVVYPNKVVLSAGRSATITCMAFNFINPSYMWMNNGKDISGISDISLHINMENPSVLIIPFAYAVTTGDYTCVAHDTLATRNATTNIEVFQDPSIVQHSLKQTVNVGEHVCLSCQIYATNNSMKVNWYKDGSLISSRNNRFNRTTSIKGEFNKFWTQVCIHSVDTSDGGEYACGITGLKPTKGELLIYVKPQVKISKDGDQLNCSVSGFPKPRLIWFKDNKHVKNGGGNVMTVDGNTANYTCFASNVVGTSFDSYISIVAVPSEKSSLPIIIGCVIAAVLLIVLFVVLICCYYRRKKTSYNRNDEDNYQIVRYTAPPGTVADDNQERPTRTQIEFHPRSNTDPGQQKGFSLKAKMYNSMKPRGKAEWEIPPECIKCDKKLGEGQFGQVWKGQTLSRKGSRTVAIKMLKENAELKERKSLIDELEFMKTMTPHPNIVGLVGCVTRSEPVMIVVEYVPHGDLKEFLINSRGLSKDTYANLAPYSSNFTAKDLMSFAYQIARGMSYLEKIKCVHRDLAARNILVGDENTCKIADFGLARDIYSENYYRKTSGGRLPLRWMAYESIFNGITTNQSDAWSFGVVLWEIVTLGGNPYPDMNRDQVIEALQQGYRMPKPHHCSDEVYSIMWDCWQQNPDKRPTFAELTASFLRLISLQQLFINMETFGEDDYVNVGSYEMN